MEISHERCEELVAEALDLMSDDLLKAIDNVALFVEDEHPEDPDLLGLYEGIPLTERDHYSAVMPDKITIYRKPHCAIFQDEVRIREEIVATVRHEVRHHLGGTHERGEEFGWD